MDCQESKDLVYEYLDGALTPEHRESLLEHLKDCIQCRRFYREEKSFSEDPMTDVFEAIKDVKLKDDTITRVSEGLKQLKKGD